MSVWDRAQCCQWFNISILHKWFTLCDSGCSKVLHYLMDYLLKYNPQCRCSVKMASTCVALVSPSSTSIHSCFGLLRSFKARSDNEAILWLPAWLPEQTAAVEWFWCVNSLRKQEGIYNMHQTTNLFRILICFLLFKSHLQGQVHRPQENQRWLSGLGTFEHALRSLRPHIWQSGLHCKRAPVDWVVLQQKFSWKVSKPILATSSFLRGLESFWDV